MKTLTPQNLSLPVLCALLYIGITCAPGDSWAKDGPVRDLSDGARVSVLAGSAGLGIVARILPSSPSEPEQLSVYRSGSVDRWWRERIHGGAGRKSNFVDHKIGSLIAPVVGGVAIALIDINRHEFSRDIPFFVAGAVATGAITTSAKKLLRRPRPYTQEGGALPPGLAPDDPYHTESFYSGHASQAFFAAGFVNNRLRRHMRQEWHREEYRSWRWAAPLVTFGWAGFVGWSRIHADKHHFTDVLTGALVGYAMSEVYYRLCYGPGQTEPPSAGMDAPILGITLTF